MEGTPKSLLFVFESTWLHSQLFFRYLTTNKDIVPIYHPFATPASLARDNGELPSQSTPNSEQLESNQKAFISAVKSALHEDHVPLANDHWFNVVEHDIMVRLLRREITDTSGFPSNPTHIPDEIFYNFVPIILIHNPVLAVQSKHDDLRDSTQKVQGGDLRDDLNRPELIRTNSVNRLLFDFFRNNGRQPIVIDVEDIIWRTRDLTSILCPALGDILEPKAFSESWEPTSHEKTDQQHRQEYGHGGDALHSNRINRPGSKPDEPDVEAMYREWIETYGKDVADKLKESVEYDMPHYLYLRRYKI